MKVQDTGQDYPLENIPDILPILPVFDVTLFPKMVLPLVVSHKSAIALIDDAMAGDKIIGLLLSKKKRAEGQHTVEELHTVGTLAVILKMARSEDNKVQLMVQGLRRFQVEEFLKETPYFKARIEIVKDIEEEDREVRALTANLLDVYQKIVKISPTLPAEIGEMARSIPEPGTLADMITSTINCSHEDKQDVLETPNVKERLEKVTELVTCQLDILEIGSRIQSQVKQGMNNKQREYYLRQQLQAIREELGEPEEEITEVDEYRAKVVEKKLPPSAIDEAERELKRLSRMHPSSSEYTVTTSYLDWLTSLPWEELTPDNLDIKRAKKILDEDHFGLDKAKKRIIEYLSVRKLKPDSKGPILCLSGPPGSGKTSLGRSVARALDRKFFRISLGGMRDEAEIRGHRRTYVGAMPGRIIQGIRRVGSSNPVIVLDEIDKVGTSFKGDPSSALLEVLDPEQNSTFSDYYLDVPFDLSRVIFITTANVLHTIPPALRDRLEVIDLAGYTDDEKLNIANRYLIPRQRKAHGLKANQITITKGAVKEIIQNYTREAGLRMLERNLASVCRGAASTIAQEEAESVTVKVVNVPKYLGPRLYSHEINARITTPGVVMGLAWTSGGGELLYIEATAMRGSKGLSLTGQLGGVMKESATTALSFIRSNASQLGINEDIFSKIDIHIHVPAGAIPKDGPSAGITILTALVSLLTSTQVKQNLAMTGEITLRGKVLPVGGVKEKILAAHRAGIKTIVISKWNEKDLEDLPKKVLKSMEFFCTDNMMEVLKIALERRQQKGDRREVQKKTDKDNRSGANERRTAAPTEWRIDPEPWWVL